MIFHPTKIWERFILDGDSASNDYVQVLWSGIIIYYEKKNKRLCVIKKVGVVGAYPGKLGSIERFGWCTSQARVFLDAVSVIAQILSLFPPNFLTAPLMGGEINFGPSSAAIYGNCQSITGPPFVLRFSELLFLYNINIIDRY